MPTSPWHPAHAPDCQPGGKVLVLDTGVKVDHSAISGGRDQGGPTMHVLNSLLGNPHKSPDTTAESASRVCRLRDLPREESVGPEVSCSLDQWVELELKASGLENRWMRASVAVSPLLPRSKRQDVAQLAAQPLSGKDTGGHQGPRIWKLDEETWKQQGSASGVSDFRQTRSVSIGGLCAPGGVWTTARIKRCYQNLRSGTWARIQGDRWAKMAVLGPRALRSTQHPKG